MKVEADIIVNIKNSLMNSIHSLPNHPVYDKKPDIETRNDNYFFLLFVCLFITSPYVCVIFW